MFPASIQDAIDCDSPKTHLKNILNWSRSLGFLPIPEVEFQRVKHLSEVEIVKAAIVRKPVMSQLVDDGITSWGLLPGLFSDLRILTTRSQTAYELFIRHPQCTRVRFYTPNHGHVLLFRDPNRQRVNLVAPTLREQFFRCRDLYLNDRPRPLALRARNTQVTIRLPAMPVMNGFIGDDIYAVFQRETAFFKLPAPEHIGECVGLRDAVGRSRDDMQIFYESRLLKFAVSEIAF